MLSKLEIKKSLLTCPGDTLQEHLDEIGMSSAELGEHLGLSVFEVYNLLNGTMPIDRETATRLEKVLNIPANFLLNLEGAYREELVEIGRMEGL